MSAPPDTPTTAALDTAMDYLLDRLRERLTGDPCRFGPLDLADDDSPFATFVEEFGPTVPQLLVLLLSLLPEVRPGAIDTLLRKHLPEGGDLPEFGGLRGKQYRGVLPTGQTALFLLAGHDRGAGTQVRRLLGNGDRLWQSGLLRLGSVPAGEPGLSGQLLPDPQWLSRMLEGRERLPAFGHAFPARPVVVRLDWEDLVLPPATAAEVDHLRSHLGQQGALRQLKTIASHLRPGYRILFHGPPGTGKTLTAGLLGKQLGKPVFRVELSAVVSKYIGETEKRLATLFERAEHRDWILFFDEADALFGKRSEVSDGRDRYANQEVSYLLQRIEDYDGIAILATNFRSNLDGAFSRRFEAIIHFEPPGPEERGRLWRGVLPDRLDLAEGVDTVDLARRYELSGSQIAGAARFALTDWLAAGAGGPLSPESIRLGVQREFTKAGKIFKP